MIPRRVRVLALDIQADLLVAWVDSHGSSGVLCFTARRDLTEARHAFNDWIADRIERHKPDRLVLVVRELDCRTPAAEAALGMRDTAMGHARQAMIRVSGARAKSIRQAVTGRALKPGETMSAAIRALRAAVKRQTERDVRPLTEYAAGLLLLVESAPA